MGRQSVTLIQLAVVLCTALMLPVVSGSCPRYNKNLWCVSKVDINVDIKVDNCDYTLTNVNRGTCVNNVTLVEDCTQERQCESTYYEGPPANAGQVHRTCIPSNTAIITGAKIASLSSNNARAGCAPTKYIPYEFVNVTSCKCDYFP